MYINIYIFGDIIKYCLLSLIKMTIGIHWYKIMTYDMDISHIISIIIR